MATTKQVKPKLEIVDDVDFIRLGGRVYSITDVGKCSINSVLETAKKRFEDQANAHTETVSEDIAELAREQEREQLEHLRTVQSSNVCVVQQNDFRKMIVAHSNGQRGYSEARTTLWRPRVMYFGRIGYAGLASSIRDNFRHGNNSLALPTQCYDGRSGNGKPENVFIGTPLNDEWSGMCLDILNNTRLYNIAMEEFIPPQVITTYFDGANIRMIPALPLMGQMHTHCMSGQTLCTGNMRHNDFWANREYHKLLQPINWESFAAREFQYVDEQGGVQLWNMHSMIRQLKITSMTREEATTWRTTQRT